MAAVDIAQIAGRVVVVGKKKRGEGAVRRVVTKEAIDFLQQALRLFECQGELAAQVGLQIGHQQRGGNSLPGDIGDHKAKAVGTELEEVVVVSADGASR